jgi:hypothetical protein
VIFEPAKWRYSFLNDKIKQKQHYSLSFTLDFRFEDDVISVAYCVPYTYSELLKDIAIV